MTILFALAVSIATGWILRTVNEIVNTRRRHRLAGRTSVTGVGDLVERLTAQRRALPPALHRSRCTGEEHVHARGSLICLCGTTWDATPGWLDEPRARPAPTRLPGPGERSSR